MPSGWVLLSYRLPREPSAPRIALWRKLRRLGVAQLLDGLVGLPEDARNRERLEWLAEEVAEAGGEASVWLARPASVADDRMLVDRMRDSTAEEYRAVVRDARAASRRSPAMRRRTLARLRREMARIGQRDYFGALRSDAVAAIEALSRAVEVSL